MKSSALLLLACVSLLCAACAPSPLSSGPRPTGAAESASSLAPRISPPERWQLANGLTVMFSRDDELPLVSGGLFTRGGSLWESMSEFGVAAAMGSQMRQGGAGSLSADALDQRLDELSASLSSSVGQEFGRVQFASLSSDFDEVFRLFADVVLRPRFENDRLGLWLDQTREAIRRRVDDPNSVASTAFNQLLFGKTPYGWSLGTKDLERFTRSNLVASHHRFIRPNGAMLVISGRIERATVERAVHEMFGAWQPAAAELPPPPAISSTVRPGIYFVKLPLQQSTIIAGQRGVPRLTPDHLAIEAFNSIFGGGGFGSRLMKRVRTEGGMAYSVYGSIVPAVTQGKNIVYVQTKTETTARALLKSLDELSLLQKTAPDAEELAETTGALVNSFVFNFDSPAKVMSREATLELLRYPKDYDQKYIPGVQALSPEDVRRVADTRWNLSEFVIVVVGNEKAFEALRAELAGPKTGGPRDVLQQLPLREVRFDERLVSVDGDA